ncbi:tetratricopeptide repeat protein [Maioricimonas sp. JC845]|uniref:tetratricopeptide repeat protein n=1 Tax=Maioricimonas sp. JC845 TaxID=3232138 RepID=UPI00345A254D
MAPRARTITSTDDAARKGSLSSWLAPAGLTLLTLLVFARTADYDFVNFDDNFYVGENPQVLSGLTIEGVVWAFSPVATEDVGLWHPLTWLSLMTTSQLFGSEPRGFHLANVALHLFNVLLLYRLLLTMTERPGRSAFVAAVFAVHPLHVESVAWVSEHKDVLSTALALLSMWWHVRWVQTERLRFAVLSVAAFVLSLLAKPMYVTLPFLLVLLDAWPLKTARASEEDSDSAKAEGRLTTGWWLRSLAGKWPYLLTTVIFCGIAYVSQQQAGAVRTLEEIPLQDRLINAVVVYGLYLLQTVWPVGLAVFYPYPEQSQLIPATVTAVLLTVVTVVVLRQWRFRPWLAVGWFWYLGTLVPVIGLVQIGRQQMADRYMYFPMIGLLIAVTWFAADVAVARRAWQRFLPATAVVIVAVLSWGAIQQVGVWRNSLTLFTHAIDVAESSLAHTKVGFEHARTGELDRAVPHFRQALVLDPDDAVAHAFLGHALLDLGETEEAIRHLEETVRLVPDHTEALGHLGIARATQGDHESAVRHLRRAVELSPDAAELHMNLGVALTLAGQREEAAASFRRALKLTPSLISARLRLAQILSDLDQPAEAIREYRQIVRTNPGVLPAHVELARLYLQYGQREVAVQHLRFVLTRAPGHADAQNLLKAATAGTTPPDVPKGS